MRTARPYIAAWSPGTRPLVDAATAQLDELLARVARGERLTLMRGGRPVADLAPGADALARAGAASEAIARGRAFRARLRLEGVAPMTVVEKSELQGGRRTSSLAL